MCGNCAGAATAVPQTGRTLQTLVIPNPGSGSILLNLPTPQPLPQVTVTAPPFPWGRLVLGVVLFLILTRGAK